MVWDPGGSGSPTKHWWACSGLRLVPACDAATALYTRFFCYLFPVQVSVCAVKNVFDGAFALAGLREFTVDAMLAVATATV